MLIGVWSLSIKVEGLSQVQILKLVKLLLSETALALELLQAELDKTLGSFPANLVLCSFLNQANTLKDVGNVIDSAFLDTEIGRSLIKVHLSIF